MTKFIVFAVLLILLKLSIVFGIYGENWVETSAPIGSWISITSDSTGKFLAAVQGGYQEPSGYIYTSTSGKLLL